MTIPSTNHPLLNLSLQRLREHAVQRYRQGGRSRPDVLVIDIDGDQAVLKDHNQCDRWFATLLGPLLVWREQRALKRVAELEGIPRFYRCVGSRALLMEHLPGVPITKVKNRTRLAAILCPHGRFIGPDASAGGCPLRSA